VLWVAGELGLERPALLLAQTHDQLVTNDSVCRVSLTGSCTDQAGGALSFVAVPRVGLWPTTPPLCHCAKSAADLILQAWRVLQHYKPDPCHVARLAAAQTILTPFAARVLGLDGVAA
jgi:hypothetical protein